jgi:hypothetical protein
VVGPFGQVRRKAAGTDSGRRVADWLLTLNVGGLRAFRALRDGKAHRWFSSKLRYPSPLIAEKWAKTSPARSSGVMNPKPLSALNHLTVPVVTSSPLGPFPVRAAQTRVAELINVTEESMHSGQYSPNAMLMREAKYAKSPLQQQNFTTRHRKT